MEKYLQKSTYSYLAFSQNDYYNIDQKVKDFKHHIRGELDFKFIKFDCFIPSNFSYKPTRYDPSYYIFLISIKSKGQLFPKKVPVIVEKSDFGYVDVISGADYHINKHCGYNRFPNVQYVACLSSEYVASIIRSLNEEELADYIKKSNLLNESFIKYADMLRSIEEQKELDKNDRQYKRQKDEEFIRDFQRTRAKNQSVNSKQN